MLLSENSWLEKRTNTSRARVSECVCVRVRKREVALSHKLCWPLTAFKHIIPKADSLCELPSTKTTPSLTMSVDIKTNLPVDYLFYPEHNHPRGTAATIRSVVVLVKTIKHISLVRIDCVPEQMPDEQIMKANLERLVNGKRTKKNYLKAFNAFTQTRLR